MVPPFLSVVPACPPGGRPRVERHLRKPRAGQRDARVAEDEPLGNERLTSTSSIKYLYFILPAVILLLLLVLAPGPALLLATSTTTALTSRWASSLATTAHNHYQLPTRNYCALTARRASSLTTTAY